MYEGLSQSATCTRSQPCVSQNLSAVFNQHVELVCRLVNCEVVFTQFNKLCRLTYFYSLSISGKRSPLIDEETVHSKQTQQVTKRLSRLPNWQNFQRLHKHANTTAKNLVRSPGKQTQQVTKRLGRLLELCGIKALSLPQFSWARKAKVPDVADVDRFLVRVKPSLEFGATDCSV